jgi:hypothetical protein
MLTLEASSESASIPSFGSVAFSFSEQPPQQRKTVTLPKGGRGVVAPTRGRNATEDIQVGMWYKVFKDTTSLQRKDWNAAMEKTIGHSGLVKALNTTNGTVRLTPLFSLSFEMATSADYGNINRRPCWSSMIRREACGRSGGTRSGSCGAP